MVFNTCINCTVIKLTTSITLFMTLHPYCSIAFSTLRYTVFIQKFNFDIIQPVILLDNNHKRKKIDTLDSSKCKMSAHQKTPTRK
jgi:hypothetical protein